MIDGSGAVQGDDRTSLIHHMHRAYHLRRRIVGTVTHIVAQDISPQGARIHTPRPGRSQSTLKTIAHAASRIRERGIEQYIHFS